MRLPALRVARLDRDVVERRGEAARIVDDFTEGRLDVLVGTSLVTKGLDVPETTLVGVVSADVALTLPDERAAERTWQLLAQAVGRAGRGERPGRAIIQTYLPDHPAIVAVAEGDARPFVEAELDRRKRFGAPPYGRLVKLTAAHGGPRGGGGDRAAVRGRAAGALGGAGPAGWRCWARYPRTWRAAVVAGGSTSCCAATTRWRCWAATRGCRGAWTSTRRACCRVALVDRAQAAPVYSGS